MENNHKENLPEKIRKGLKSDEPVESARFKGADFPKIGKKNSNFRLYDENLARDDLLQRRVFETYKNMHKHQTFDFNLRQRKKWLQLDRIQLTVMEALELLNSFVDSSDPDIDLPNIVHAYQTAERVRKEYPEERWFHLTGLIHDLGKVLCVWGEPQWAVVGDTFVVGCAPASSVVYSHCTFENNPDLLDPRYNTANGIYQEGCGLDNLILSWGHDEYLYHVIKNHPDNGLPEEALSIIRYHSFYPWHSGGDYWQFANEKDKHVTYTWVKRFNQFDLYSKSDEIPDIQELKPYYQSLIDMYLPGLLKF